MRHGDNEKFEEPAPTPPDLSNAFAKVRSGGEKSDPSRALTGTPKKIGGSHQPRRHEIGRVSGVHLAPARAERKNLSYARGLRSQVETGIEDPHHPRKRRDQVPTSRAMAKAAVAAREPTIAVCSALRTGATPVIWPLTPPKIKRAAKVNAIEIGSARETVGSKK